MDFMLFEHQEGLDTFKQIEKDNNDMEILPEDVIAFTHVCQSNIDENGKAKMVQYRIGVPVKFVIGDMYITLKKTEVHDGNYDQKYCIYVQDNQKKFCPINENMHLVSNFNELENAFYGELIKEKVFTYKK